MNFRNIIEQKLESLPIPPPYSSLPLPNSPTFFFPVSLAHSLNDPSSTSRLGFLNERTGEVNSTHPMDFAWENVVSRNLNEIRHGFFKYMPDSYWKIDSGISPPDLHERGNKGKWGEKPKEKGEEIEGTVHSNSEFIDFRCSWKESGVFGIYTYGLLMRYFLDNGNTLVKFDGIEGEWQLGELEGPFGPADRNDLFIGGKVKLFGRSLTISTANASVCHLIDIEGKRLQNMIKWLQTKIETVGAVPVIRREVPTMTRHIQRNSKAEGHQNLRKLKTKIARLGEQLAHLGLSYLLVEEEIDI